MVPETTVSFELAKNVHSQLIKNIASVPNGKLRNRHDFQYHAILPCVLIMMKGSAQILNLHKELELVL